MTEDDVLPPQPPLPQPDQRLAKSKKKSNGSDGSSRSNKKMRECICRTPTLCRDLTYQWSRIGEGRYVDYILLPPPPPTALAPQSTDGDVMMTGDTMKEPTTTKGGKHGFAFRNVVYHGLGHDDNCAEGGGMNNTNDGSCGGGFGSVNAAATTTKTTTTIVAEKEGAVVVMTNNDDTNNNTNDIQSNNDTNKTVTIKRKNEFIAMVHFDPRIIPFLRRDGIDPLWSSTVCKRKKVDKWRVPLHVGREIGYTDDYLCPDADSTGTMTFFAVPNYNLDVAAATLKLAMTTWNDTLRQVRNEDAALLAAAEEAATTTRNNEDELGAKTKLVKDDNPKKKMVARMQHINQTNATLKKENIELRSRLLQNDTIRNTLLIRSIKLTRVHDRLSQRVERLEKNVKQTAKKRAREKSRDDEFLGKIGVGDDNGITTTTPTKTRRAKSTSTTKEGNAAISTTNTTGKETKRGKRNSDARMDRAVEAKFHDPSLSAEEALRIGGFVFSTTTAVPPPVMPFFSGGSGGVDGSGILIIKTGNGGNNKGGRDATIVDTDNISLAQRKNNLLRRLRLRRNAAFEAAATAVSAVQHLDSANVNVGLQWGGESV